MSMESDNSVRIYKALRAETWFIPEIVYMQDTENI